MVNENQAPLATHQFTVDSAVNEWLAQKETRTGSQKTRKAYEDTMRQFRVFLKSGGLDLLSNPIDIVRLAALWANMRTGTTRRPGKDVSPATYNQRLAILSSWYTFVQEAYKLDIPNPIESVKKRPVQAYAAATPVDPETVEQGLENINRSTLHGMRDYALLAVALYTGRRAHELVNLRWQHVRITGKKDARITLTFHCEGNKIMHDKLDVETSAVLLEYLYAQNGKNLLRLATDAPVWVSCSRATKGQAISAKTLSNICADSLDTSKVHALRHTFAVGMVRSGASITDLAGRLGHTDIKITQTYTKEIMGDENPYGEKLTARFGIKRKSRERTNR
jgi:site-specific recombinase XerD